MDDRVLTSASPDKRNSPGELVPPRTIDTHRVPTADRFMYELNDHLHRRRCTIVGIHPHPIIIAVATQPRRVDTNKTTNHSIHRMRDESLLLCPSTIVTLAVSCYSS